MHTRRSTPQLAVPLIFLAFTTLVSAWVGCSASGSHTGLGGSGGTGGGTSSGSGGGDGGTSLVCGTNQKVCNGQCVGVDDPAYGCGPTSCTACAPYTNASATCSAGACAPGACNTGWANCNGNPASGCETNVGSDPNNCGGCGVFCNLNHAQSVCSAGVCTVAVCDTGWTNCASDAGPPPTPDAGDDAGDAGDDGGTSMMQLGCFTNSNNDPSNCGTCGNVCPSPQTCQGGICGIYCQAGYCSPGPNQPCNVMLGTNTDCKFCGDTCSLPNATANCDTNGHNYSCDLVSCNTGYGNCDGNTSNGCETALNTVTNCGTCGTKCQSGPNSTATCNNNTCGLTCSPGYADCNGNPADGCETPINTVMNCGACASQGGLCVTLNGTPVCNQITLTCAVGACSQGYANCPGDGTNCSTFVGGSDVNNCGGCGNVCTSDSNTNGNSHNTGVCVGGHCAVGQCDPGWLDCDGNVSNGCETPVSATHCGACNVNCSTLNGTPACNQQSNGSYTCGVGTCNSGFAHCSSSGTDCETDITTSSNCGACGNNCNADCGGALGHVASTQCTNPATKTCGITACSGSYTDFNATCSDGCECNASATQSLCNNAISLFSGTLQQGQSITPWVANMGAAGVSVAWYTITFGQTNTNTNFHPLITISSTNNEFVMDIDGNCNGTLLSACNDGNTAAGVTSWETHYTAGDPTSKTAAGASNFQPIGLPGSNGQVWIKVYRKNGATPTCGNYTISVSD